MKLIFCAGNNKSYATIAIKHGWLYGVRSDHRPYFPIHFVDINWKNYNWKNYVDFVDKHKPEMAIVPDYEERDKKLLLSQIKDIENIGVREILVCPKFNEAIRDIPEFCTIAISVPSNYSGFLPRPSDTTGRIVHLLGGTPQAQVQVYRAYASAGARILSIDCNEHMKASRYGTYFESGMWRNKGAKIPPLDAFEISTKNIKAYWNEVLNTSQASMFGDTTINEDERESVT